MADPALLKGVTAETVDTSRLGTHLLAGGAEGGAPVVHKPRGKTCPAGRWAAGGVQEERRRVEVGAGRQLATPCRGRRSALSSCPPP